MQSKSLIKLPTIDPETDDYTAVIETPREAGTNMPTTQNAERSG